MALEETRTLVPFSPYAALLVQEESKKTLVIADVHLGWEVALAEEGVHIPSQTSKLLSRLQQMIALEKPDSLLVLGDVRYSIEKINMEEWRDVPDFFEELCKILSRVMVMPGNHDGNLEALLPRCVEILPQQGIVLGDAGLFHGHTWPEIKMLGCSALVIGHVHPVITFKDPMGFRIIRQVWIKAPCNGKTLAKSMLKRCGVKLKKSDDPADVLRSKYNVELNTSSLFVMPSFNDFLGGRTINRSTMTRDRRFQDFIGPILRSGSIDIEKAEVYLLDGTYLGELGRIKTLG